jgi:uncharacterized protein (DUF58 family)
MTDLSPLFDETFLVVRRRRSGQIRGERRSTKRGSSVEFADYRDYTRGDDLRRVDWNIYARLERPFVKLFEEEEDLTVHLLLDASGSMDWPPASTDLATRAAPTHKWTYARRTAAALGYVALSSGDRLGVSLLQGGAGDATSTASTERFGPARGKGQALRLLHFLAEARSGGDTDLDQALRAYAFTARRPGLAILISDLFSPVGYQEGLSALLARGYEVMLLHVLSPEEANPHLWGDLKLVDIESGHEQEVTVDAAMRGLYRDRLAAWQEETNRWCGQRGAAYVPVVTDTPFDELILFHLRRRGLVR